MGGLTAFVAGAPARRWGDSGWQIQAAEGTTAALRIDGVLAALGNLGSKVTGSLGEGVISWFIRKTDFGCSFEMHFVLRACGD